MGLLGFVRGLLWTCGDLWGISCGFVGGGGLDNVSPPDGDIIVGKFHWTVNQKLKNYIFRYFSEIFGEVRGPSRGLPGGPRGPKNVKNK